MAPLHAIEPNPQVSIEYGTIQRIDYDNYLMDIFLTTRMKTLKNVPISIFNAYNSLGITVVPVVNQEVAVIYFQSGPVMVLPFITRKHKLSAALHRPKGAKPGDIYLIGKGAQLAFKETHVRWQIGEPTEEPEMVLELLRKSESEPATALLNAPKFVVFNDTSIFSIESELKYTAAQDETHASMLSVNKNALEFTVQSDKNTTKVSVSDTGLQLTFNDKVNIQINPDGSANLVIGNANISINSNGEIQLSAQQLAIKSKELKLDADNLSMSASYANLSFDNLSLSSRVSDIKAAKTSVEGNIDIGGGLQVSGNVEIAGNVSGAKFDGSGFYESGRHVAVAPDVNRALNELYLGISNVVSQVNAHMHIVEGPVPLPTSQPSTPITPGKKPADVL
jgi:hypothetical protein